MTNQDQKQNQGGQQQNQRGRIPASRVVKDPPNRMSRGLIEKSFVDQGFQLYKVKKAATG